MEDFVSTFGRSDEIPLLCYPTDICYMDRWNTPSSAASSLLLVDCGGKIFVWDADHRQHVLQY